MDAADKLLAAGSELQAGSDWSAISDNLAILEDVQTMVARLQTDQTFGPYMLYLPPPYLGTDRRVARRIARACNGRFRKCGLKRGYVLTRTNDEVN